MGQPDTSPNRAQEREVAKNYLVQMHRAALQEWDGFSDRPEQKAAMAKLLMTMLRYRTPDCPQDGSNIAVLEAGTGFGKTVAYGLPAIAAAAATGKRIVFSTATVALQEQLFQRDLPRLVRIAERCGIQISTSLMMGRSRFVCLDRLQSSLSFLQQREAMQGGVPSTEAQAYITLYRGLADQTWSGQRNDLLNDVPDSVWSNVQAERTQCAGRGCAQYDRCVYYAARNAAKQADVVVANHNLVLASLTTDVSLFDRENTIFILDEGHHLDRIARDQFAPSCPVSSSKSTVFELLQAIKRVVGLTQSTDLLHCVKALEQGQEQIGLAVESLKVWLKAQWPSADSSGVLRLEFGNYPVEAQAAAVAMLPALQQFFSCGVMAMNSLRSAMGQADEAHRNALQRAMQDVNPHLHRVQAMVGLWTQWAYTGNSPRARWVQFPTPGSGDVTLHASALTAGGELTDRLWSRAAACVVVSATLSVAGSLDYFKRVNGLSRYSALAVHFAKSPFNYQGQGVLGVVETDADPKDSEQFAAELAEIFPRFLRVAPGTGALAIFTSRANMQRVADALPEDIRPSVLMQGEALSKAALLREHERRIEAGMPSILLVLDGMGEGTDLPGRLCVKVLIDKIPFKPPGGPVEQQLHDCLSRAGKDPFSEVALPQAAQKLAQWVGRLIRSPTDQGEVLIFDKRLLQKRYGQTLLDNLPNMPVEHYRAH